MKKEFLIILLFAFGVAQKSETLNDEKVVNNVLHLETPNEVIDRMEDDPEFFDEINVRFELAATFGKLQFESLQMIDENLKIMVAGTIKEIKDMNVTNWSAVLDYLDQVPYLKMAGERRNFSEDSIIFPKTEMLDFKNDFDANTAFIIEIWFDRLIKNYYALREMNINITKLANFAAKGEKISIFNALVGAEYKRRALMDLAILRFPDIMHPYFMVFTVQLIVYRDSWRLLVVEHGSCGVLCRFNYAKYIPNKEYIESLREKTKAALLRDIDMIFDMK